jgi:cation diffusion facilitator CzcD-associated flavoprotein CzcO
MQNVAVIGAGPGGLVSARYLSQEGFSPVIFDQNPHLGGQWAAVPGTSGVWPAMRTNTSRIMTSFSDLPHPPGTATYPTNQQMRAYLENYAAKFDLISALRLDTQVEEIVRDESGPGWRVRSRSKSGEAREEIFSHVVIASGRYNKPMIPEIPGLITFAGKGGTSHTFDYKHPEKYRDLRVLVGGCAISALEIASDLAMLGAAKVISSNRRMRYIILKLLAGVPAEHRGFTRFSALAMESFSMEANAQAFKDFVLSYCGSPEEYGAPKPDDNIFKAGIALSQHFLPLVAEGRIAVKPWIDKITGNEVHFTDGTTETVDAILFGTGFTLNLPFLSKEIRDKLDLDEQHADLFQFTFHPDLPNLAFIGMMELQGPYFPVLELQARWIAYTWSGKIPTVPRDLMQAGIDAYRARRGGPKMVPMHIAAITFARAAGVEPNLDQWPELANALMFGPLSPISFRLNGHDNLADAATRVAEDAKTFGAIPTPHLAPMQKAQLQALAAARNNAAFTTFVEKACRTD